MISGWPHFWRSSSPSARMKMSLKPPALVVVMALTGRVGQSCAAAGDRAARPRTVESSSFKIFMRAFPVFGSGSASLRLQVGFLGGALDLGARLLEILGELGRCAEHRIERALN